MLDVAVVGGGLCGLALASLLRAENVDVVVFEARQRLGGRILTVREPGTFVKDGRGLTRELPGLTLDCGPTWFWPADNPRLSRLLAALGLETFGQHETGHTVFASGGGAPPRRRSSPPAYASARRIVGGAGAIVEALEGRIGTDRLRLDHELVAVLRRDDFIELVFAARGAIVKIQARRGALALPPRLLERIEVSPPLSAEVRQALVDTPTWMASQAKALAPFSRAFWRENGDAGAALCFEGAGALAEVFDACDAHEQPALGGFFALGPEERNAKRAALGELVHRQLAALFGPLPEDAPAPRIQDWATERFTTAALDLERPALELTAAPAVLREALWDERLFIGGSETAAGHPGHMEGAVEAALRIASRILALAQQAEARNQTNGLPMDPATEVWLATFRSRVQVRKDEACAVYREVVQRALSAHDAENITQRALLEAAATVYRGALGDLASAPFAKGGVAAGHVGDHLRAVLAPLVGWEQDLIADALKSNQTSCAMRAFPEEARPDGEYMQVIRTDLQTVALAFAARVEGRLRPAATPEH